MREPTNQHLPRRAHRCMLAWRYLIVILVFIFANLNQVQPASAGPNACRDWLALSEDEKGQVFGLDTRDAWLRLYGRVPTRSEMLCVVDVGMPYVVNMYEVCLRGDVQSFEAARVNALNDGIKSCSNR